MSRPVGWRLNPAVQYPSKLKDSPLPSSFSMDVILKSRVLNGM